MRSTRTVLLLVAVSALVAPSAGAAATCSLRAG